MTAAPREAGLARQTPATRRSSTKRRGAVIFWLLLFFPFFLILFFTVTTIGSLWLARAELHNLADAAALAGAKVWGDGADDATQRTAAHLAAQAVAQTNLVLGSPLVVDANDDSGETNNNAACPGTILLGRLDAGVFSSAVSPSTVSERACRVTVTTNITVPFFSAIGTLGPFPLQASSIAYYDGASIGTGTPRLTLITDATCDP